MTKTWHLFKKWLFTPRESSFGPIMRILDYFGAWRSKSSCSKTILFYSHLMFEVIYSINLILNVILNYDFHSFLNFVNYSAYFLSPIKISHYAICSKKWEILVDIFDVLEKDSSREKDTEYAKLIAKHRMYGHLVLIVFWLSAIPMSSFLFGYYWLKNIIILNHDEDLEPMSYIFMAILPFDQNTIKGRYLSGMLQTLFGFTCPLHILCWDSLVLTAMVFLIGQLKALKVRCVQALNYKSEEMRWRNLLTCYHLHIRIIKCSILLDELISFVMSIYLLQVVINCAICVVKIVIFKDNRAEVMSTLDLLLGLNGQLLLFYWIANEVTVQSQKLSYAVFESNWVEDSVRIRRAVYVMSIGMTRLISFNAGPFNKMSLATFITILKSSYSFYTLLNRRLNLSK